MELGLSCDDTLPNIHLDKVYNKVLLSHAHLYY
jgi:hypothetical protein